MALLSMKNNPALTPTDASIQPHSQPSTQPRSLLDVMDGVEGGDFEFEPAKLDEIPEPLVPID